MWDYRTLTPLERPANLAEQAFLSDEERAEQESAALARDQQSNAPIEVGRDTLPVGGDVGAYNSFWVDQGARVVEDQRTSLIVDPPSGRLPELQPGVEMTVLSLGEDLPGERPVRARAAGIGADSFEDRGLAERCILGFNSGPPIVPIGYNQNIQIFQTADHFVILNEMVHDARIVPLDGREHLPEGVRQWMGDSPRVLGTGTRWWSSRRTSPTGTASFNPSVWTAIGEGTTLHLTERFSRTADDTLLYEFTVNDPASFTRPFTAALPMKAGRRHLRVRVPRRELRAVQHPGRRAGRGAGGRRAVTRRAVTRRAGGRRAVTRRAGGRRAVTRRAVTRTSGGEREPRLRLPASGARPAALRVPAATPP